MDPLVTLTLSPVRKVMVLFSTNMAMFIILNDIIAVLAEIVVSNQHVFLISESVVAHDAF